MTKENRILFVGLGIAFALPLVLGLLLGWPAWVIVPLLVLVLVGIYRKLVYGPRTVADQVGALLDKIGLYEGDPVRELTASRLAKFVEAAGDPRAASEVRERFDSPRHGAANSRHHVRNIFSN
ncbi:hypothetical protein CDG81_18775 [Actinopolyspora erythraea]|uniref:Uncharacterized protein n=1 Tax=Actinopolyspora erythraea TaxID=414996 RepID=A0A099DAB1_9ACTN|nr:hypothetical protein [Actinopolyspora erythraea]ASU79967.1 hypothetical protein CDG81_18775 [Actinopolyspora erythraea]KGI82310.1 hypothetical protein IL38_06140 [Actinopolyspora erythraea]